MPPHCLTVGDPPIIVSTEWRSGGARRIRVDRPDDTGACWLSAIGRGRPRLCLGLSTSGRTPRLATIQVRGTPAEILAAAVGFARQHRAEWIWDLSRLDLAGHAAE